MTYFYNLCSSSSGNSTYIGSLEEGILIDAGIGIKTFEKSLKSVKISPTAVRAIFITHEHIDHVKGLDVIAFRYNIPIYASKGTIDSLLNSGKLPRNHEIHIINREKEVSGYKITPFRTSHDAKESLGFKIKTPSEKQIGICTDLGYVSKEVFSALSGCDFVMLESNYDESMLMYGKYPVSLKKRISSEKGHLSNEQCAETIERLILNNTKKFVLAHLSEHNNNPKIAFSHLENYLKQKNIILEKDYFIDILDKVNNGRLIEII